MREEIYSEGRMQEFEIEKSIILKEEKDITLITAGTPLVIVKEAVEKL